MGEKRRKRILYDLLTVDEMSMERYGHKDDVGQQSQPEQEHIDDKLVQDARDKAGADAAGVAIEDWAQSLDEEERSRSD